MSFSIYLILLIVLLVFNLVFWLLIVWFRILLSCDHGLCCSDTESSGDSDSSSVGHRNPAFADDDPVITRQVPYSIMEAIESPPSYEEALKYDQFGFQATTPVNTESLPRPQMPIPQQAPQLSTGGRSTQMAQSPPRTSEVRPRSSTTSSISQLTPIREEDDDVPVAVVIDCIGVQAARLVPNCDTKVAISDGEQLSTHSKC